MKDELDYTTRRLGSTVKVCPECGRRGLVTQSIEGDELKRVYVHRKEVQFGPGGWHSGYKVTDSCVAKIERRERQPTTRVRTPKRKA